MLARLADPLGDAQRARIIADAVVMKGEAARAHDGGDAARHRRRRVSVLVGLRSHNSGMERTHLEESS